MRALGLELGPTGAQCQRFAAVVDNGILLRLKVEQTPGDLKLTHVQGMLKTFKVCAWGAFEGWGCAGPGGGRSGPSAVLGAQLAAVCFLSLSKTSQPSQPAARPLLHAGLFRHQLRAGMSPQAGPRQPNRLPNSLSHAATITACMSGGD